MIPDFAGKVIEIVRMDFGLRLWTEDNWEILLSGPVLVTSAGRGPEEVVVDVEAAPLPPAVQGLEGQPISSLLVSREGHLGLTVGQRQLSVSADPAYEAWQLAGHDGERLICMPGGELAHFPPVRDAARNTDAGTAGVGDVAD
ncbi:MAG: DUF6188 family protein [Lapillicoccus sp.]